MTWKKEKDNNDTLLYDCTVLLYTRIDPEHVSHFEGPLLVYTVHARIIDFSNEWRVKYATLAVCTPTGHRGASVRALDYRRSCAACKIAQGQEPRRNGERDGEIERDRDRERRCAKHSRERYNLVSLPRLSFSLSPPVSPYPFPSRFFSSDSKWDSIVSPSVSGKGIRSTTWARRRERSRNGLKPSRNGFSRNRVNKSSRGRRIFVKWKIDSFSISLDFPWNIKKKVSPLPWKNFDTVNVDQIWSGILCSGFQQTIVATNGSANQHNAAWQHRERPRWLCGWIDR